MSMILRWVFLGWQVEIFSDQSQLFSKESKEEKYQAGDKEKQGPDRNALTAQQNRQAPHRTEQQE